MSDASLPVTPRLSATILLLRDSPLEVLMVRRHKEQFFASALVFPGGTVDDSDRSDDWLPHVAGGHSLTREERALRIAAFRETFEESALLLARHEDGAPVVSADGDTSDFRAVVERSGGKLWLDDLAHFGHWITPEPAPQRYDTHFFLTMAPAGQEPRCDGNEAVALEWVKPVEVISRAASEGKKILFPTRLNLQRLAKSDCGSEAMEAARLRPRFTVLPRVENREGGIVVVIPAEAGYDDTEDYRPHGK